MDEMPNLVDEILNQTDKLVQCLIVDDDPLICDLLEHFCSKIGSITNVLITNSGFESINLISQHHFDLILLDYDLPDLKGKDILQVIHKDTKVIMITSHKDFASESYNYDQIVDFLVKPVDFMRFAKAIQKAQNANTTPTTLQSTDVLFVKDGSKLVKVNFVEVLFVRSAANYVEIFFDKSKILTLMTLKEMEQKLPAYFQRIHRSTIVNINKIDSISTGELKIKEHELGITEAYDKALLSKIKLLK